MGDHGFVTYCFSKAQREKREGTVRLKSTEVKYPLLRACSSSAGLKATGLHTHVRIHRTSSDPAYFERKVYLYMREKKKELFPESGPNTGFSGNGFTKTVTLESGPKQDFRVTV